MSLAKYESEVKPLYKSQQAVYERLSDLRNLEALRSKMDDPKVKEAIDGQVPDEHAGQVRKVLEDMTFDADTLSISTPMGAVNLRVVEREEPKLIKLASEGSPVPLYVWIQLVPADEESCKMRITVGAEVNMFMRTMVSKPLQQAADGLATILAAGFAQ